MQSTGQTSTQLLSLTPMHGWAITYATAHRSSPDIPGRERGVSYGPATDRTCARHRRTLGRHENTKPLLDHWHKRGAVGCYHRPARTLGEAGGHRGRGSNRTARHDRDD